MLESPEKFKRSLQEALSEFLWRQWRSLGIAAYGAGTDQVIDLEALILATTVVAGQEKRLWDAARHWLQLFREWVSLSRLKHMASTFTQLDPVVNIPLIDKLKWETLLSVLMPAHLSRKDAEDVRRAGQLISPLRLKDKSLVQLCLRGIFGLNARAELFLYLLANGEGNSNQIARETQYDQKNVYLILERWAETGFVTREKYGKQNLYSLAGGKNLMPDIKKADLFWEWPPFFVLFSRLYVATHHEPWANDGYLLSSLFRDLHPQAVRIVKSLGRPMPDPVLYPGEEYFVPGSQALLGLLADNSIVA